MASTARPPPMWQSDMAQGGAAYAGGSAQAGGSGLQGGAGASAGGGALGGGSMHGSATQVADAYRHVKVVCTDARRDYDLHDLLLATRREETYQAYPQGWPGLLRTLSPTLFDLPAMVQEKYRACQAMCFCGLFPGIRRAWASVDNSLFVWRYDKSGDVPVEYCGEQQAVCAVGIVRPRQGVFLEAVRNIIVLCTTSEVVLLGVCPSRRPGAVLTGSSDEDLTLQPLPMYTCPSDNVVMTCVAASSRGRIFLGGSDGHVYEIKYAAADGWRQKRCSKVKLTGGLKEYMPSFLPGLLGFGASTAVDQLVVDDERNVLYSLSQSSAIQAFDLGAKGDDPARRVGEIHDFYEAAQRATHGREVFRSVHATGERAAASVRHIAPIPVSESARLHLVAVTADGRRVYLTTGYPNMSSYYGGSYGAPQSGAQGSGGAQADGRPHTLLAVIARPALPYTGAALGRGGGGGGAGGGRSAPMEVVAATYSSGSLLLSEAAGTDRRTTKLLLASRNSMLPLASVNLTSSSGAPGLRETLTELDNFVPGEACAVCAVPQACALGPDLLKGLQHDDLLGQVFCPPPRFVLISTAGVLELERRRPRDVLQQILEERASDKLRSFFEAYGAAEAAAMAVMLAAARPGEVPPLAVREAVAVLEDPALVGEPRLPEDVLRAQSNGAGGNPPAAGLTTAGRGGGIYMGQAVNPNPEPDWSSAHRGVCLYLSRLLQPVWDVRVVVPKGKDRLLQCRFTAEAMECMQDKLFCLQAFLKEHLSRRAQRGYASRMLQLGATGMSTAMPQPSAVAGAAAAGLFGPPVAAPPGQGGDVVAQQANKRQRLTHAAMLEDEQTARVRALAARACEALALLQLLAAHNIGRLAQRLDDAGRRSLGELTLRDLVTEAAGEATASRLISVLVTGQLDGNSGASGGAGVDEIAGSLQRACPSYFREADRVFYQASAKLKQAEALSSPAERDALTADAVAALCRVPLSCNLEYLVGQLAYLRAYDAIVALPLCAAAASDPEGLASRSETGERCDAARARRNACYQHIVNTLRTLVQGAPGGGGADGKGLSASERATYKAAILKAAAKSGDVYFHHVLYGALIDMDQASEALAMGTPHLEPYLLEEAGLTERLRGGGAASLAGAGASAGAVGPLGRRQVQAVSLLAKLYVSKRRFRDACGVYTAMAGRRGGPGEFGAPLSSRVSALQSAVLQAKSLGDSALVEATDMELRRMTLQAAVAERLDEMRARAAYGAQAAAGGPSAAELDRLASELQASLRDVSELYNDYAQPLSMWDVCLRLIDFAGAGVEPALVRQLWDHMLLQAWESAQPSGAAAGGSTAGPRVRLEAACAAAEPLGGTFFPNDGSFPLPFVAFRLEQMAAGLWPPGAPPSTEPPPPGDSVSGVVSGCLARACRGSLPSLQRAYELLLARRAPGVPDAELASVRMRTQLLASLLSQCRAAEEELAGTMLAPGLGGSGAPSGSSPLALAAGAAAAAAREAGALADACERYALEARRLGAPGCEELAGHFDAIKRKL